MFALQASLSTAITNLGSQIGGAPAVTDPAPGPLGASVAAALGGGATLAADGALNPPSYAVQGVARPSVGAAVAALDAAVSTGVRYDPPAAGGATASVTLGPGGAPVALHNVAAGTADADAANVGQVRASALGAVAQANGYTDLRLAGFSADVDARIAASLGDIRDEAHRAAALGLAAAGLRYDPRPGKLSLAMSAGGWQGKGALAAGLGYTSHGGALRFSGTAATSGGEWGGGIGVGLTLN